MVTESGVHFCRELLTFERKRVAFFEVSAEFFGNPLNFLIAWRFGEFRSGPQRLIGNARPSAGDRLVDRPFVWSRADFLSIVDHCSLLVPVAFPRAGRISRCPCLCCVRGRASPYTQP